MMRLTMAAAVAVCVTTGGVLAAPAGKGESVTVMKEQLAKLKAQEAALEARIAAAEAPAAGTVPALVAALNAMPRNLWPGDSDSSVKESLRDKWLDENIKVGTSYEFTGSVSVCSPTTINEAGKPSVDAVQVVLDCGKQVLWGVEKQLKVIAAIGNVKPADALDWNEKTMITISGKSKSVTTSGNPIDVRLETSSKK